MASDDIIRNALKPGQRVLWFEIERTLGQGGFGITYIARDTNLAQQVALKEYLPTELAVRENECEVHPVSNAQEDNFNWGLENFMLEARTLAHFDHPNIIKVYTVFEANNTAYMVMRYEDGMSLGDIYSNRRRLRERLLHHLVHPLLDGLESIHKAGFIHRDIKPDNIYLRQDASPVLLDFGSARLSVGSDTRGMTSLVTPGYAPFEQYVTDSENQGPWSDIYSFGATLYRGIAGRAPQDATNRSEALSYTGNDVLVPAVEVGEGRYSETFLRAVDAALAFRYDQRPQSVAEWRAMFKAKKRRRKRVLTPEPQPVQPVVAEEYSGEVVMPEERFVPAELPEDTQEPLYVEPAKLSRTKVLALGAAALVALTCLLLFLVSMRSTKPPQTLAEDANTMTAAEQPLTGETEPTPSAVSPAGTQSESAAPTSARAVDNEIDEFRPIGEIDDPVESADASDSRSAAPAEPLSPAADTTPRAATEKRPTLSCADVASLPLLPAMAQRSSPAYANQTYKIQSVRLLGPKTATFESLRQGLQSRLQSRRDELSQLATNPHGELDISAIHQLASFANQQLETTDLLATAFVPMQLINQQTLRLLVTSWHLGETTLSGVPGPFKAANTAVVERALAPLHDRPLHKREFKKSLLELVLNDAFHGSAFAILKPGNQLLAANLVLRWQNAKPDIDPAVDADKLFIYSVTGSGALLPISQLTKTDASLGYHETAVSAYQQHVLGRLKPTAEEISLPWHCQAELLLSKYRENWQQLAAQNSLSRDFDSLR